jgi:uncharacterized protein YlzI (FlbEa/FlbD family)
MRFIELSIVNGGNILINLTHVSTIQERSTISSSYTLVTIDSGEEFAVKEDYKNIKEIVERHL